MGAAGHEVHRAVPERVDGVQRRQELDVRVEPLGTIEAELLGGERGEVRVRDQIRPRPR